MLENMLLLNWWVATATLVLELGFLGKLFSLLVLSSGENSFKKDFVNLIKNVRESVLKKSGIDVFTEKFLLYCIFIFSLGASFMTLVYSEIFMQAPCALCWFQRVFMYGIVVVSGTALYGGRELEQRGILKYILNFSILGFLFAGYHHAQQFLAMYGTKIPCPATNVDCSKMTIFEYGHITFPWMAVVLFAFFIVIILLQRKVRSL